MVKVILRQPKRWLATIAPPVSRLAVSWLAVSWLAVSWLAREGPAQTPPIMEHYRVLPTAESIEHFLYSLQPDEQQRGQYQRLIEDLGHEDYQRRELATRTLMLAPTVPVEMFQAQLASSDDEVRWRADVVVQRVSRIQEELLAAIFREVAKSNIRGLARPILQTASLLNRPYLRTAAEKALAATIVRTDAALLAEHLSEGDARARAAALYALNKLDVNGVESAAGRWLESRSHTMQFAAARVLADRGNRAALSVLANLLESPDEDIRAGAVSVLRAMTDQGFGYSAHDDEEARAEAVRRWKTWVQEYAATASINYPVGDVQYEVGRTLICVYRANQIIELDARGNQTWELQLTTRPWGCQGLPNGHRLIATFTDRAVTEYDTHGNPVWRVDNLPPAPMSALRLVSGNTLVVCADTNVLVELDRLGNRVWEVTVPGRPLEAQRLENGRTLVVLQNNHRVVEIDHQGREVWAIAGLPTPTGVERLPNGNTLIACIGNGTVSEYNRAGDVVWSKPGFRGPYGLQRLPSGNTLIADQSGVTEIDEEGAIVWSRAVPGTCDVYRF